MGSSLIDLDLSNFVLPAEFHHDTQHSHDQPTTDRYGVDKAINPQRWEKWIVKLQFHKLGENKHGNGFYVNIPNKSYDVIFTAGHNLVEAPKKYSTNIRIITARKDDPSIEEETPISSEMTRIHPQYFEDPDELNAIYDYGIILIKRKPNARERRGFGFNFATCASEFEDAVGDERDVDVLQDRLLNVSAYRPADSPVSGPPKKPDGNCVVAGMKQLVYRAATEEGMSGGAVWMGFRGVETVVAIHNYGEEEKGKGNRGTRLSFDFWNIVFGWLDLGWTGKSLHYTGFKPWLTHLHMHLTPGKTVGGEGRLRVGKPGRVDTLFDILPISALPNDRDSEACYGFLLPPSSSARTGTSGSAMSSASPPPRRWLRWDATKRKLSLTNRLDAQCEVKLLNIVVQPTKPFQIQARLNASDWVQVRMNMDLLGKEDLALLEDDPESYEDTSGMEFVAISTEKFFEFK